MPKTNYIPAAILVALVASPAAFAAEGEAKLGFPLGDKSRVHTNLDVGFAYDTNPFRLNAANQAGDVKLTVRPGLAIDVPGTTFTFDLQGKLSVEQFFGVSQGATSSTQVGGDLGVLLRAGSTKSTFGFELADNLARTPTFFAQAGTPQASEIRDPLWYNTGTARFVLRPGGGALEFRAGYLNRMTIYSDSGQGVRDTDSAQHGVTLEAKLRFLPKTAAVFYADFSFFEARESASSDSPVERRSNPYNVEVGLQGQLTERLRTIFRIGYGDALNWDEGYFSSETDSTRTIIGRADFTYQVGHRKDFTLGYRRSLVPVIVLRSYVLNSFHGSYSMTIADRLRLKGSLEYQFRDFTADRQGRDLEAAVLLGDARVTYAFFPFLDASLTYQVAWQRTDDPGVILEEFARHLVMASANFHY